MDPKAIPLEQKKSVSVFDYLDYRKFLGDFYEFKKNMNRAYSHRLFSRKADIKSTGYFSEVMKGKRKLSKAYARKFARGLDLNEKEQVYFELLVSFTHAKSNRARQALYDLLVKAMPIKTQYVKQSQMEYFSKWYYVAVREALSILKVKDDYRNLAVSLQPAITPAQAKSAVKLLGDLGLIEKGSGGYWRASHLSLLSHRDESSALMLRAFQDEMLDQAKEALEKIPPQLRDISCVTLSVSQSGMQRIKILVEEFHKQVIEIVQSDHNEDRVMQLNLQLFPLTRIEHEATLKKIEISRIGLGAVSLLCCHCANPTAGTSTTVGNNISAMVLRSDSSAAAGVSVTARDSELVIENGQPQSKLLAATVTDARGYFTLPISPRTDYYLEIKECPQDTCSAGAFPEVYFHHYFDSLSTDTSLGALRMSPSATLTGRYIDTVPKPGLTTWIGIRGTADFVKPNPVADTAGGNAFELDAVYPGAYNLTLVFGAVGAINMVNPAAQSPVKSLIVQPGAIVDIGSIYYSSP